VSRLAVVILTATAVLSNAMVARAAGPVVVLKGPGEEQYWGSLADEEPSGLLGLLCREGYRPGEDLFILDCTELPDPDPISLATSWLDDALREIGNRAGGGKLDIICHGLTSVAVRYWAALDHPEDLVDTVIMLGPPNRGSWLAFLVRLAEMIAEGPAGTPPHIRRELESAADRGSALYGEFVQSRFHHRWDWRLRSFQGWLLEHHGPFLEEWLQSARDPLPGPLGGLPREPVAEEVHTALGYYRLCGLVMGHYRAIGESLSAQGADWLAWCLPDGSSAWQRVVAQYLFRLALRAAGEGARWAVDRLAGLVADRGKLLLGCGGSSTALARLLPEEIPFGQGTDKLHIPCNILMRQLNQAWGDGQGVGPRRWVAVAGRSLSPWSYLWAGVGPNDLALQLAETVLPLGPEDEVWVCGGIWSANYWHLARSPAAQAVVLRALKQERPVVDTLRPDRRPRPWRLGPWRVRREYLALGDRPSWVVVEAGQWRESDGQLRLMLYNRDPVPQGWRLEVWAEQCSGDEQQRCSAPVRSLPGGLWSWALDVLDFGTRVERVSVGFRLVPEDWWRFQPGVQVPVRLEVEFWPSSPGGSKEEHEHPPATGTGAVFKLHPRLVAPAAAQEEPADVPTVVVKTARRLTTSKKEKRTYHQRWVWDLGDGTTGQLDDPEVVRWTLEHTYRTPGSYRPWARSVDNRGHVLRYLTWEVTVSEAEARVGKPVRFELETLTEPAPSVTVHGPRQWMVGLPARYRVEVDLPRDLPYCTKVEAWTHPGRQFEVVWERSGEFEVQVAVTVKASYQFPEKNITIYNTYLYRFPVKVIAPALSR